MTQKNVEYTSTDMEPVGEALGQVATGAIAVVCYMCNYEIDIQTKSQANYVKRNEFHHMKCVMASKQFLIITGLSHQKVTKNKEKYSFYFA